MKRFYPFIKKYQWPIFSGVIIGTSYIPLIPWGILFGYLPLWFWLMYKAKSSKEAFIAGWVCQFVLTIIGFHWIAYTAKEYGHFPWPIAFLTLLAFSALAHLYISIISYLFFQFKKKFSPSLLSSLIFLSFAHSISEIFWPGIFPWNMGYTLLWAKLPFFQFADLIGFTGLSFILLVFHIPIGFFWIHFKEGYKRTIYIALCILLFIFLNIAGWFHAQEWQDTDKKLNILTVQANIGNFEKAEAEKGKMFREAIIQKHIALSEEALTKSGNIDLIL
ncbi:MAG: apolipoprotein N-acyltransferase, partial [Bdellovibrionales bacterium]|nr:apolipoprotein N-acyltransferase [Bdellovibrionales bacterium]